MPAHGALGECTHVLKAELDVRVSGCGLYEALRAALTGTLI